MNDLDFLIACTRWRGHKNIEQWCLNKSSSTLMYQFNFLTFIFPPIEVSGS